MIGEGIDVGVMQIVESTVPPTASQLDEFGVFARGAVIRYSMPGYPPQRLSEQELVMAGTQPQPQQQGEQQ